MPDNKFESFFYENNIFYLEDNLTNDGKLLPTFNRDALFCPECKSARLKFTSATSQKNAFLSTWPGDAHIPNCDYGFESASKKRNLWVLYDADRWPNTGQIGSLYESLF